jgi:hypothetical protein
MRFRCSATWLLVLLVVAVSTWSLATTAASDERHAPGDGAHVVAPPHAPTLPLRATIDSDTTWTITDSPHQIDATVIVSEGAMLTIQPGVQVQLADSVSIVVFGGLSCVGTPDSMIVFEPAAGANRWGAIGFIHAEGPAEFRYARFYRTQRAQYEQTTLPGVITSYTTHIEISDCEFEDQFNGGQGIAMRHLTTGNIERNSFVNFRNQVISGIESWANMIANYIEGGDDDAIEYGDISGPSEVSFNFIDGCGDDGIDVDGFFGTMTGNYIRLCSDKGISISSDSAGRLENNLVYDSLRGMAVTAGSLVDMWNNTISDCIIAMEVKEKNTGWGGGTALGSNNIFWGNLNDIQVDSLSSVDFTYSNIQGDTLMAGEGNINVDPLFVDPDNGDFHLSAGSPCIDAGLSTNAPALDFEDDERIDDPWTPNTGGGTIDYVDIGFDEYQPETASVAPAPASPPAAPDIVRVRPNPLTAGQPFLIQAHLRQHGELRLIDVQGRVRSVWSAIDVPGVIAWDGRDAYGRRLSAGVYFLEFRALGELDSAPGWTSRFTLVH